jgi:hypothetical protein
MTLDALFTLANASVMPACGCSRWRPTGLVEDAIAAR